MISYPTLFPCVSRIEGHSAAISAGLVRTPMEGGNTRQRRSQRVMPHTLTLVFVMDQPVYGAWLTWVNANAFDNWITLKLPGLLAARAGATTVATPVRFMSDIQAELMPASRLWYWRCRVTAEWLPTAYDLESLPLGAWIGADLSNPPPDWIIAGVPGAPSLETLTAGTPGAPSALA